MVAQLVEHWFLNPTVEGSSPSHDISVRLTVGQIALDDLIGVRIPDRECDN